MKVFSEKHVFKAQCDKEYDDACIGFNKKIQQFGGKSLFTSGTMADGSVMLEYILPHGSEFTVVDESHTATDDVDVSARCSPEEKKLYFEVKSIEDETGVGLLYKFLQSYFPKD